MDVQLYSKNHQQQDAVQRAWQKFEQSGRIEDYIGYLNQQHADGIPQTDLPMGEADPCLSKHRELF